MSVIPNKWAVKVKALAEKKAVPKSPKHEPTLTRFNGIKTLRGVRR